MLLNKSEAILCGSQEEALQVAQALEDAGYKMFHPQWPSIEEVLLSTSEDNKYGFRWLPGHEFPLCVATMTDSMLAELVETGEITCGDDVSTFRIRRAADVLCNMTVCVEDLL